MIKNAVLEARIGRLLDAYADQADVDVDPTVMTRLASSAGGRARSPRLPFAPARVVLGFVFLIAATLTVIGGTLLVVGRPPELPPITVRVDGPEPFLGLPPLGAPVSAPDRGDLELSFGGRILSHGFDRVWVYADGRIMWLWENPYPSPIKERWLRPEGVALLREELLRTASFAEVDPNGLTGGPGTLWGFASLRLGERVVPMSWSDSALPRRLVDPAAWLPDSAWEDPRTFGYAAPRYAVCIWPDARDGTIDRLPSTATAPLLANGVPILNPGNGTPVPDCYEVTLAVARVINDALIESGMVRRLSHGVSFTVGGGFQPELELRILPMTPDGEVICDCG
jgi:hypothetical protein